MASKDEDLELYLAECVNIDRSNLQDEFCRVPADLAFWAERLARVEGALVVVKANVDKARAKADQDLRSAFSVRGEKVTEARISSLIDADQAVNASCTELATVTAERARLRGVVDAIAMKGQMLMSLGAIVRQEMRTEPHTYG